MIKIIKQSIKTKQTENLFLDKNSAIMFLYNLKEINFRANNYYLITIDNYLTDFFNPEFFIPAFLKDTPVYLVNNKLGKRERQNVKDGISATAILNFREKIKKEYPNVDIDVKFSPDYFTYILKLSLYDLILEYDYFLNPTNQYLFPDLDNNEIIEASEFRKIESYINNLFNKQRYYYKKTYGKAS